MRILFLFLAFLLGAFSGKAQETTLIRELVSREFSIHVGGLQTPDIKEIVSREFSISVENGAADRQRELFSREFSLVMTTAAPPPRFADLGVVVSAMGDIVTLNWSGYNPWAVGDVLRFDVYLSDAAPFQSVSGRTPKVSVSGEQLSVTLTGLTPFTDHYLAVVPVDALGNFDPIVNYSAAYVLTPELVSREFSLHIENGPSTPQAELVSREYSVVVVSTAPPPAITSLAVTVSAEGDSATLDWSSYNQYAVGDIVGFDVYYSSEAPFSSVTGRTPLRRVPGGSSSVVLTGLARFTDHYFAVVPVDGLEQFVPEVKYAAGYVLSPQVVSREFSLFIENGPAEPYPELVSREFSILVPDAALPAPVTGLNSGFAVSTATTEFGAVVLDWTPYNELAQRDVVQYRVYVGESFFENVEGLVPVAFVNAGTQRFTLGGQPGNRVLHFAVVAEDALGGFNPVVRSVSGQTSVSGVGEVVNLTAESGADRLRFTWDAPGETGGFLAGYRVFFGDSSEPVNLPSSTRSWEVTGLAAATGYPVRVSTVDTFGKVSPGVTRIGATWLPNPSGLMLTANGEDVLLSWSAADPESLVKEYRIVRDVVPFTDASTLTPIATTTGTSALLGTIASVSGGHFAVVTVNISNGSDPTVVSVSATRERQTVDFPIPNLTGSIIPLVATSSSGLPVSFLGGSSSVAVVEGNTLRVVQGGVVTVTAYQAGNGSFWPADQSRELRIPPVIQKFKANGTDLNDGLRLTAVEVRLGVEVADTIGLGRAEFYGRPAGTGPWTLLGWDENPAEGWSISLNLLGLPRGDYDVRVVAMTSDGAESERVRRVTLDPIPLPDLLVHAFDLPATAFAGQSVTIGWTTTNAGIGGASGGWSTRVSLSQHENGALLLDRGTVSTNRALAVDESVIQAASILVPPGWSGQGYVVLELDVNSAVNESNEGNNRVVSAAPIQILAPDLVLESLGGPNSALLGQTISVTWGVTNRGGASTTVGWRDRVWLTPTAGSRTGATELTAVAGPEGGLSASAGYARTASVTVPLSTSIPPGDYFLLVEADGDGSQPELDKANNRSSRPLRLGLPPSPNLAVSEVTAPASALPGGTIEVHWKVSNLGSVPVVGPWKETLSVSNSVQGLRELALLSFEGAIPAGGVAERTHTLNLPPGTAAGVNAVWVATDAKNEVVESDETDNRRRSEATVSVPQVLTLALSASQIREDASVRTIRGTLTRNGPVSASLRVLLTGADATEITAPAEVTLPAGQSAIVFDLTAVADNVVDGHQAMTLGVNADGYAGATAGLTVLDADLYRLFVTVDPATVAEGGVVTGTVRREDANGPGLTVTLVSSQESQLSPTPSVTIPAGEASATFEALAVNDNRPESPTDYTLVASAPAHHDGTATVRVLDNDVPSLVISLASRSVSEGAGPYATSATVTRKPVGNGDVTVELVNPNPGLLLMPSRVTITGGRDSK
ncbi:MAG: CARDB domain-containing protein, partial [Limisphaerales bacterium]